MLEVREATEKADDLLPVVTEEEVEAIEEAEAFDEDLWWFEDSIVVLFDEAVGWPLLNIDRKSVAVGPSWAEWLELPLRLVFEEEEELEDERFWAPEVEGAEVAPNQSKGFANGLTALKVEFVAVALKGGLNMVAAAAAAAE